MSDLSPEEQEQRRQEVRSGIKEAAEMFTPLGDVQTAKDASKAFQEGRYLDAAGNAALIAAGYTPLGPLARPAGRLAKRVVRDKDMLLPALTDKDYAGLVARETIMGKGPLAGKSVGAATAKTKTEKDLIDGLSPMEIEFQKQNPGTELLFQGASKARQDDLLAGYREKNLFMAPDLKVGSSYGTELTAIPVPKGTAEKMIHQYPIRGSGKARAEGREQIIIGPEPKKREQLIKEQGEYFENEEAIDFLEEMFKQTGIKPFKVKK
ncbi:hypothetical protein OAV41_02075 [Planctomycetota bacterium]|nr:hypothetical protein [Planctomycetota bacterium]